MKSIQITPEYTIGDRNPCFIIAEVGINHNGDLALAKEMITAATEAGADAVKFQNYRTEDFMSDKEQIYKYRSAGKEVVESMFTMFKRYEIDRDFVAELKSSCDQKGIVFTSTPTSQAGIDDLLAIGAPLLKNGSDYLTNLDLIRRMAETGLPTLISCGMSTEGEIDDAVQVFREAGNEQLMLLHCTSSYPTLPQDVHLRKLAALEERFNVPVGLSDHTDGIIAGVVAASMGAGVIEKHFTINKQLPGPDHSFSCDPAELKQLVDAVREAEKMMGSDKLGPTEEEEGNRLQFRLSCVAAHTLEKGQLITRDDIAYKRPGFGIPPRKAPTIIGRRAKREIPANSILSKEDFSDA